MEIEKTKVAIENGKKVKNKYVNKKTIPYICGYLVTILLMLSMSFIADPNFNWEKLGTWQWWAPNLVCSGCIIMVLITRLKQSIAEKKENDEELKSVNSVFLKKVQDSKFNSDDLQSFMVAENKKNKLQAYRERIEERIATLNRSPLTTAKALKKWASGDKSTRYGRIREKLELQIAPEYIDNAINYIKVPYKEWTFPALMAGVQKDKNDNQWITENEYVSRVALKKSLFKIVLMVAMASIGFTLDFKDWSALVNMFVKIFSVLFSLLTADQLADTFVNVNVKGFAFDRLDFFNRFEERKLKEVKEEVKEGVKEEVKPTLIEGKPSEIKIEPPPLAPQ